MRKVREVFRLKFELKRTHREIAVACCISPGTVSDMVGRWHRQRLEWPSPLSDTELEAIMYPPPVRSTTEATPAIPDWEYVHRELKRRDYHMTLHLVWDEYAGANPKTHFGYSWFCENYRAWAGKLEPVMRQVYKYGEKCFVDFAGDTLPVVDPETGEVRQAQVFVATLGASNYTYCDVCWNQDTPSWLHLHMDMFYFFGGCPAVLVPDYVARNIIWSLQVALDTTPILGRGAVQDTYNLIAAGIRKLGGVLAKLEGSSPECWSGLHDFSRYWDDTSLKGEAGIDWSDDKQRRVFLNSLVADAQRILLLADKLAESAIEDHAAKITEASTLLRRLIAQDTEPEPQPPKKTAPPEGPGEDAAVPEASEPSTEESSESDRSTTASSSHLLGQMIQIRKGTAANRVISVHDPEMRHGCKSASKRFDGHKLSVVVDTDSKLCLAVDVIAGNASDNQGSVDLVRQAEANTGLMVEKAIGDCAYGDGPTRQAFEESGIELSAKVPASPSKDLYPKSRFALDLTNMIATCPAGQSTTERDHSRLHGEIVRRFRFPVSVCGRCPHRSDCLRAKDKQRGLGRTVVLNPHEELIQRARSHQASPAFREDIKARQSVEHYLARMTQIGVRQARYLGMAKTKYQALMTAMVANLVRIGGRLSATILAVWALWVRAVKPTDRCRLNKSPRRPS